MQAEEQTPRERARARRKRVLDEGPSLADTTASAMRHVGEAKDYVRTLIDVRSDQAGLAMRRKITQAGIFVIAAIGAATCVIAAMLLFVNGLAGGLAALFLDTPWLGDLVSGTLLLALVGGGIALFLARRSKSELAKLVQKYERIHDQHRAEHGHHISDPSPAANGRGAPGA